MFASTKAVIGLDVGSYSVKAVALQSNRDRITLQGYAQAKIGNEDVGEVIKRVVGQLGVKAKRVVTAVSGRSVIVRQVETPKLLDNELKQHITYEADKYIPFGTEEVIIDCQPMPPKPGAPDNTQQVMLVAVRKGFIQEHLASLRTAGLMAEVIDVDVFALSNAYELLGPPMPPEAERKATAIVDIGATKTNISIMQSERVLFTREIYLAGNEISDAIARTLNYQPDEVDAMKLAPGEALESIVDAAMPAFEDLANEIRLSFDYVEGQFDCEVATVVLSGGTSQLPTVAAILGNILSRPVYVFDPLAGLDLVPSKYDIHGLDANSPGLTVALGLAAHVLNHAQRSLGGQQSHNWQPRSKAVELGSMAQVTDQAADDGSNNVSDATQQTMGMDQQGYQQDQGGETQQTQYNEATAQTYAEPEPRFTPPPEALAPPPQPVTVQTSRSSGTYNADMHKSGLLVVLDEEEDIPSDRIDKQTAAIKRGTASQVRPASFDDSGENKKTDLPDLPELPKL
jgi:type IV pilus assembly protein PilM